MKDRQFDANADNCADKADEARAPAERNRYRPLEKSWRSMAETQRWLDGLVSPFAKTEADDEGGRNGKTPSTSGML